MTSDEKRKLLEPKQNPIMVAEMDEEDNYNMIDGIPNNSAKSTKQAQSILQTVQEYQQQLSQQNKENTESFREDRA